MPTYPTDLTEKYSQNRNKYTSTDKYLFEELFKIGFENKKILDYGCGDGSYSFIFHQNGAKEVQGLDISPEMINIADDRLKKYKENSNIKFIVGDGNNLPYNDNSFDTVIANFVLVHFDDLQKPLKEIFRVLKEGGYFVATINCADLDTVKPVSIQLGNDKNVIMKSFLRSDDNLKHDLSAAGFNIIRYNIVENSDASVIDQGISNFHGVLFVVDR